MRHFSQKTITDPVHGNVGLSALEADVVSSRVFQRLHNIRQLGLAHLVYPGANYSRFAHSVGACHNAAQFLDAIGRNTGKALERERIQAARLAALLHDLGHYPFSHATEHVVSSYYKAKDLLTQAIAQDDTAKSPQSNNVPVTSPIDRPPAYDHEDLGGVITTNDPELAEVFKKHDFDVSLLQAIFIDSPSNNLLPLISSDLDCDRLDYLRRTAHFSGAPYGSVDIEFLIEQATLDREGRFCFGPKGLRAADHVLVSRYYDYVQIPFHKTVAALEWSLVEALTGCLNNGLIDCSAAAVEGQIKSGSWSDFDDQHVFEHFKKLERSLNGEAKPESIYLRDHLRSMINRKPPKLVAAWEEVLPIKDSKRHINKIKSANTVADQLASKYGIQRERLYVWKTTNRLSSIAGGTSPENRDEEKLAKAIHILDPRAGIAELLVDYPQSLMRQLSDFQYAGVRVYLMAENGRDDLQLRDTLCKEFEDVVGPATAV